MRLSDVGEGEREVGGGRERWGMARGERVWGSGEDVGGGVEL